MPKPFMLGVEVEEIALGKVMRVLNNLPGVVKLHMDLKTKGPNGASPVRGPYKMRKPPVNLEETGEDVVAKMLHGKPPMTSGQIRDVFVNQGRSASSINSVLHTMQKNDEVQRGPDGGYTLTKKMRDRLRHRKAKQ